MFDFCTQLIVSVYTSFLDSYLAVFDLLFHGVMPTVSYMSYLLYMIPIGLNIDLALCHKLLRCTKLGIDEKQKVRERQLNPMFIYI
jgi:hypothetical protein